MSDKGILPLLPYVESENLDTETGAPYGSSVHYAGEAGVTQFPGEIGGRPTNVVENDAELRLLYRDELRPRVVCGWCHVEMPSRSRQVVRALNWFHTHACVSDANLSGAEELAA